MVVSVTVEPSSALGICSSTSESASTRHKYARGLVGGGFVSVAKCIDKFAENLQPETRDPART